MLETRLDKVLDKPTNDPRSPHSSNISVPPDKSLGTGKGNAPVVTAGQQSNYAILGEVQVIP